MLFLSLSLFCLVILRLEWEIRVNKFAFHISSIGFMALPCAIHKFQLWHSVPHGILISTHVSNSIPFRNDRIRIRIYRPTNLQIIIEKNDTNNKLKQFVWIYIDWRGVAWRSAPIFQLSHWRRNMWSFAFSKCDQQN